MRDRPSREALLEAARRTLRDDLAPTLAGDARYRVLMAANAIAIALRQMAAGDAPEREETARLQGLLGEEGDIETLNRALAAAIRGGRFGPGDAAHDACFAHLLETTRAKLAESNPKALDGA